MGARRWGTRILQDRLRTEWWITWWQNGEGVGDVLGCTVAQVFAVRHKFKFVFFQVSVPRWGLEMEWNRYLHTLPGTEYDTQNLRRWCIQRVSGISCSLWKIEFQDLFIAHSVFRHLHCLFQSELSTECDLVLPLSVSSILSFPRGLLQLLKSSSWSSLPFYLSFYKAFLRWMRPMQYVRSVLFLTWIYVILLNFSHFRSNCPSPSFSSDAFRIFSKVLKSEHYTELCSKRSMSLPSYSAISFPYIFLIPTIITVPDTSKYANIITIINIVFIIGICRY